jgi:hypothetical protein
MKKFMVLYMATAADFEKAMKDSTPEQQKKGMEAWMQWMNGYKDAIVDHGAPLGKNKARRCERHGRHEKWHWWLYDCSSGNPRSRRAAVRQGPSTLGVDAGRVGRSHGN